jgi:protein-disulfide isomerase
VTSGSSNRTKRAEKIAALRAAEQKAAQRRRNTWVVIGVLALVVVVVGVVAVVQSVRNSTPESAAVPSATLDDDAPPAEQVEVTGTADQTIAIGDPDAPVTVTVYADFQCPACRQFEAGARETLAGLVEDGTIRLEQRMMAFLDAASSTRYSSRALNAAACVVDAEPQAFTPFHDLLFEQQPAEGTAGLPDARLAELAEEAGAGDVGSCIEDEAYRAWVRDVTDQASKDGIVRTPTVLVDGEQLESPTPDAIVAAVEAAQ